MKTPDQIKLEIDYYAEGDVTIQAWTDLLSRVIRMRAALLEGACQAALLTGTHGVLVDGNSISVTRDVPFGEIHYTEKGIV